MKFSLAFLLCASWLCLAQTPEPAERAHWSSRGYTPLWSITQDGTFSPANYLLPHDIVVDTGTVMTIEGGTTIFAQRNTRIIVKGRLVCDGMVSAPVKFAALPAQDYYVPPSGIETPRWDGIIIEKGGELVLRHARLTGTLQGIEAKPGFERMWLDSVLFGSNADARVVVAGRVAPVKNIALFSLRTPGVEAVPATVRGHRWKAPVRIGLAGLAVAGAGMAVACQLRARAYQQLTNNATNTTNANEYARRGDSLYALRNVSMVAGIVGVAGFTVTFVFHHPESSQP